MLLHSIVLVTQLHNFLFVVCLVSPPPPPCQLVFTALCATGDGFPVEI